MDSAQLFGTLDALMGDKDAQENITIVKNNEDLWRKLKVLENESSSKKKGPSIVTKCSDFFGTMMKQAHVELASLKVMAAKKKALEEVACLDSNSQVGTHDPLNVENIFEEHGVEEDAGFKHTNDQNRILDAVEKKIQSSKQMFFFAHGAEGAGKSKVMQKLKDMIDSSGK